MDRKKQTRKLKEIFARNSKNVFVIDAMTEKKYTYGDIEKLSLKLATILGKQGIKKSDKIAVISFNCVEFIIIYFACMQIGAVPIPINQKLHPKEIRYIISNSDAKLLFISSSMKKAVGNVSDLIQKTIVFTPNYETGHKKCGDLLKMIENQKTYERDSFRAINDDDTIIIIYTSGTTKKPRGVVISYESIISNGSVFGDMLRLKPGLRFYAILDLAYLGGFYNLMLIPFIHGGSIVLEKTFGPRTVIEFWDRIIKFKVDSLWLVPSILSILLSIDRSDKGAEYCKKYIKVALVGTAPLPKKLKEEFENKYSVALYENYGMSETFFISTNSPRLPHNRGVGKIMPGCDVAIVDKDGNKCDMNERGEIAVKTRYVMKRYYKNPVETESMFMKGRFYTGDIGYTDGDGYLFITDRKKDIIIRGGINISPREIEEVIMEHPRVNEAIVTGVPDKYSGERIVAVVDQKTGLSEKEIKEHCQHHLAPFKIPEDIYFTKKFPRGVSGKIQKNRAVDMILSEERAA
jgi:long-chain acyl-CoA synthetase